MCRGCRRTAALTAMAMACQISRIYARAMGMSLTGCPPMDDSDGDGIPDSSDLCPHVPGPFPLGCSDAGMDSDGDAVPDIMDLCPTAPGLPPYGCPDSDGDGVV